MGPGSSVKLFPFASALKGVFCPGYVKLEEKCQTTLMETEVWTLVALTYFPRRINIIKACGSTSEIVMTQAGFFVFQLFAEDNEVQRFIRRWTLHDLCRTKLNPAFRGLRCASPTAKIPNTDRDQLLPYRPIKKILHPALISKCLTANRALWWLLLKCGLSRVHVNVPACFVWISPAPGIALALWRHSLWPRPVQAGALPAESLRGHHRPQPVRPQRGQVSDWRVRLK